MPEISQTGDQMLTVLEAVSQNAPISAADAARICGINRTVAHRLLTTLAQRGYVRRDRGGYVLGPSLNALIKRSEMDIADVARDAMRQLANETGETVVLHGLDREQAVVLDQAVGERHLVRVQHRPGSHHPLHLGASGWSILAFMDSRNQAKLLEKAGAPQASAARIAEIKSLGYAISHDELQMGVHGIAVPLINADGHCAASLAILLPATRSDRLAELARPLMAAAATINSRLL